MLIAALLIAAADAPPVTGFYRSNQIEIGAALELDPDGRFMYQLDYGAVSEAAEGTWSSDGTAVSRTPPLVAALASYFSSSSTPMASAVPPVPTW